MTNPLLRSLSPLVLLLASCGAPISARNAEVVETATTGLSVTDKATFDEPWAMTFLPGTGLALVTEKKGRLKLWREGETTGSDVAGVPPVAYGGQGGFGDVVAAPDYPASGMIYLRA